MALIHSILMGAVAGMRSMTPLAAVANAARTGTLPRDNGARGYSPTHWRLPACWRWQAASWRATK